MKKYDFFRFLAVFLLLALFLPGSALALEDPAPQATAALVVDATYGEVLYEMNAHEKRYPASITKIMTALLTLEAVERGELALDDIITAPPGIHFGLTADSTTQNIRNGEQMTLEDLLYCTLVASANEACNVLAYAVSGDTAAFVERMNQRAAELGMTGTHFTNTHGLHDDEHYTTAWDIWLVASEAMKNETFREMVATKSYTVPATNISKERTFYNTNGLLTAWKYSGYVYPPTIGIKTGTTTEAGYCLASAAELDGRTLYCVVLGAELVKQPDQSYRRMNFVESTRLLEWGFNNFSYRTIWESSEPVKQLPVTLSETDHVLVRSEGSISALLPKDVDPDDFTQTVTLYTDSVEAPVTKGQVLGEITLSYEGRDYGTLDLVALNDVERSELMYRIDRVEQFIAQPWFKFAVIGVVAFVLFLIILITALTRKKRRRARSYSGYSGRRRR